MTALSNGLKISAIFCIAFLVSSCGNENDSTFGEVMGSDSSWNNVVYDASTGREVTFEQLYSSLTGVDYIVLGEKHYTEAIQLAQAKVIEGVIGENQGQFITAWEFLHTKDSELIAESFYKYQNDEITGVEFLEETQGSANAASYLPILETTKRLGGDIIATNLTRKQKSPVVMGGIEAADPALVPDGFELGGHGYYERFAEAMSGHVNPGTQLDNFYAAQCLTDDVIADSMTRAFNGAPMFLVVGSFHSDYRDGTVARILVRNPEKSVSAIRFIDASDYEESELLPLLHDSTYGDIADYVVFINEPIK